MLKISTKNKFRCKWSLAVSRYYDDEVEDESREKKIAEHIKSCQECKDRLTHYKLMTFRICCKDEKNINANDTLSDYLKNYNLEFEDDNGTLELIYKMIMNSIKKYNIR